MNTTVIVLLAVCFISAQAFVKRDAPESPKDDNLLEKINKQFVEGFQGLSEQVSKSFDPEALKKNVNDMINSVNKAFNDLKPKDTTETPKA